MTIIPRLLFALSITALLPFGTSLQAETSSAIDPHALTPLKRMSDTLGAAKAFSCKSKSILEVPAATGQFITLFSTGEITLKRPNKLHARLGGDAPAFEFFYDGASVSAYAPGTDVYSTTQAPSTIDAMLSGLQAETGIRFPSAPLFYSDPYTMLTRGLTSAVVVGPTEVDGVPCDHLAFRSPGVNWEIWLEANTRSLPRRLAVTFTDRMNFPRTLIDFSAWRLNPWFLSDSSFVFRKSADAKEIPFVSVLKSADR